MVYYICYIYSTPTLNYSFSEGIWKKSATENKKTYDDYFGIEGFLDTDPPLNSCLSSFNLSHNPLNVL